MCKAHSTACIQSFKNYSQKLDPTNSKQSLYYISPPFRHYTCSSLPVRLCLSVSACPSQLVRLYLSISTCQRPYLTGNTCQSHYLPSTQSASCNPLAANLFTCKSLFSASHSVHQPLCMSLALPVTTPSKLQPIYSCQSHHLPAYLFLAHVNIKYIFTSGSSYLFSLRQQYLCPLSVTLPVSCHSCHMYFIPAKETPRARHPRPL